VQNQSGPNFLGSKVMRVLKGDWLFLLGPVVMVGNFIDITIFKPFFIFHFIKALFVIGKQLFYLLFKIEFIDLDEFSVFTGQKAQHLALVKNQTPLAAEDTL
jgi:hypothetical protein